MPDAVIEEELEALRLKLVRMQTQDQACASQQSPHQTGPDMPTERHPQPGQPPYGAGSR